MDLERFLPGVIGAFVGVIGWLLVGLYIQRRQFGRQARNAARAVYFELEVNRLGIMVAKEFGSFTPLSRSSFERLLPELATMLSPIDLRTIVTAYMGHAGYQQAAASAEELPAELRTHMLGGLLSAHERAQNVLRRRAFSGAESRALEESDESTAISPGAIAASSQAEGR